MKKFLLKRTASGLVTVFGVSVLIFVVMRVLPGDVALYMLAGADGDPRRVGEEQLRAMRASLGLEKSLVRQYGDWIGGLLTGDMGQSAWRKASVGQIIRDRAPLTFQLAVQAVVLAWLVGLPLGIVAAVRQGSWIDYIARLVAVLGLSVPHFFVAGMLVMMFVNVFGWFPPTGFKLLWANPWANIQQVLVPSFILSLGMAAYIARMTRSTMLEVLRADYVRTAWSKGLSERVIVLRHVLRNSIIPVLVLSSVALAGLLGGSVVIERVFGLRGLGDLLLRSILERDHMVVQNLVLLASLGYVVINIVVDIVIGWLDPRVRIA